MKAKQEKKSLVFMKQTNSFLINKTDIEFVQTLSCGQIFSYKEKENGFVVYSKDKKAEITERENDYLIQTKDVDYFVNFFDLATDYSKIKNKLKNFDVLKEPIKFGAGIRILKQDVFEMIISFAISANNRIPRIMKSLFYLREHFGKNMGDFYAFPTLKELSILTEQDFVKAGTGYRAKQLVKLVQQLKCVDLNSWGSLPTEQLKSKLVSLSGIGPKVADCVLLFGYGRQDVFPVDTWIEKVYNQYFGFSNNRLEIRKKLVEIFGEYSGYAQQYLFFYQRETSRNHKKDG